MNPGRSRWLLRLAVVLVVGLLALFWAVGQRSRTLMIENLSEQSAELKISVASQPPTYQNLKAGEQLNVPCQARDGDRLTVEGHLSSDTRIHFYGRIGDNLDFVLLPGGQLQPRRKTSR